MKLFIFILFVAIISTSASDSEEWDELVDSKLNECATELKVPEEKVAEYKSLDKFPEDNDAMCIMSCVFGKIGLMVNGKLNDDGIDAFIAEINNQKDIEQTEEIEEIIHKCREEANRKTEECDIGGTLAKCFFEKFESLKSTE